MKHINKIGLFVAVSAMLTAASCTDKSDYNDASDRVDGSAAQSLWQNISEADNLQQFASIVEKAGYSSTLSSPNYYTVWTPVDGSFNADSILALDSASIAKGFVEQHIANYSHIISGTTDDSFISLNGKKHTFTNSSYDEASIVESNIPAGNGIMHKINGQSTFNPNVYEMFDRLEGCDSLANYVLQYEETYLDVNKSVAGSMVNGEQTYIDSVFSTRNTVVTQMLRSQLDDEDSTYVFLALNDDAWIAAYDTIKPFYNYVTDFYSWDLSETSSTITSIVRLSSSNYPKTDATVTIATDYYTDSLTKYNIVKDLVYSLTNTHNTPLETEELSTTVPDTLVSTNNGEITNIQDLFDCTTSKVENSNGMTRYINKYFFNPWESYNPIIRRTSFNSGGSSYSSDRAVNLSSSSSPTNYTRTFTDSSEDVADIRERMVGNLPAFFRNEVWPKDQDYASYIYVDSTSYYAKSSQVELDFALSNVRATKYHIYIITAPLAWSDGETAKSQTLSVYMLYNNEDGDMAARQLISSESVENPTTYTLWETEFEFPICYYGVSANPVLCILNSARFTTTSYRSRNDQEMRIAGIYLVPDEAYEYVQSYTE